MTTKTRRCVTVLYPNMPGVTFDFDYYLKHHATLIDRLYGDSIAKLELRRGTATPQGSPAPYIAVIGNNSAMNQIRYGQLAKYGEERGNVGNLLGDVAFGKFAEMLGGYGEEVRDPAQIAPALLRARESVHRLRRSAVINIWVDPREYAPGTKNQTMYK